MDWVADILKFECLLQNSISIHALLHVYEIKYALFFCSSSEMDHFPLLLFVSDWTISCILILTGLNLDAV